MALLQRITTPFAALLPDLNRVPEQRQAVGAVVASLVFHLLLLLLFVAISGFLPEVQVDFAKSKPELQPLELTVELSSPEPTPLEVVTAEELKARAEKPVIDSSGLAKNAEKPKDSLFESDENLKAGSEKPATGDAPLPSQDGRTLPGMNFKDEDVVLGAPKVDAGPPKSAPEPMAQPKPVPRESAPTAATDKPIPEPAAKPAAAATPPPVPEVVQANDSQIAIASKMSEVKDGPVTELTPATPAFRTRVAPAEKEQAKTEPMELAKLVTPAPRATPSPAEGFREQQFKTKIEGGITNRGPTGVDADRTARGVFSKQVKAAIGSRWFYYMKNFPERYAVGSATLSYSISKDGKIGNVRLLGNTSNASFAMMCQQCVQEAEIGRPPEEVLPMMRDGKLEDTFTFTNLPPLR